MANNQPGDLLPGSQKFQEKLVICYLLKKKSSVYFTAEPIFSKFVLSSRDDVVNSKIYTLKVIIVSILFKISTFLERKTHADR